MKLYTRYTPVQGQAVIEVSFKKISTGRSLNCFHDKDGKHFVV